MKTLVFCDFDGTISRRDVGYSLFHHFSGGRNDLLLPDWKAGRMSSRECLTREAEMVTASSTEILTFLDQFEIDPGFASFVELCRKNNTDLVILSDGLDFYIHRILARNGLTDLSVICNIGKLDGSGLTIEFPRTNRECARCGSCKGEIIEEHRARHQEPTRTVFIGDGYSDTCATRAADLLLAKKDLERYCLKQDIKYTKFDTFFDVARVLAERGYMQS
jgi:2-hydroxy-3-keto-5-methylthiopentenyl-1-phosphate phosphatase